MRRRRLADGAFVLWFFLRRGRERTGPSAEDLEEVRPGSGGGRRMLWSPVQVRAQVFREFAGDDTDHDGGLFFSA